MRLLRAVHCMEQAPFPRPSWFKYPQNTIRRRLDRTPEAVRQRELPDRCPDGEVSKGASRGPLGSPRPSVAALPPGYTTPPGAPGGPPRGPPGGDPPGGPKNTRFWAPSRGVRTRWGLNQAKSSLTVVYRGGPGPPLERTRCAPCRDPQIPLKIDLVTPLILQLRTDRTMSLRCSYARWF